MVSSIPILYNQFLNEPIWPIDVTLTDTYNPGETESGSNSIKEISSISRTLELQPPH